MNRTLRAILLGLTPALALVAFVVASVVVSETLYDGSINLGSVALFGLGYVAQFALSVAIVSEKSRRTSAIVVLTSLGALGVAFVLAHYVPLAVVLSPFLLMTVAVYGKTQAEQD